MMNLDLLRTFLAVQRHRSYTEAGKEVFLSQPAVWRQVRRLEADLGVRLFERLGNSLSLTDAGRTLELGELGPLGLDIADVRRGASPPSVVIRARAR